MNEHLDRVRRAVEEAFRQTEERLRFVLDRAHVGFWDWSFERRQLEWSPSCKRMFGFDDDEDVTYERFLAAVHPEDRDQLVHELQSCIAGCGEYDTQFRIVRRDGSVRWMHVKGDATFVGLRATRIAGIALDVTDRRRVQEELAHRERLFRTLVTTASQSVWFHRAGVPAVDQVDDATGLWWRELTGQTLDELTAREGRGWLDAVHPDDRDAVWQVFRRILTEAGPIEAEFRVRRYDGEWRWLRLRGVAMPNPQGGPADRAGTVADVTEQRLAAEALRQHGMQLETLLNAAPVGMYLVDSDFHIRAVNPIALPVFGDIPDLIGRDFGVVARLILEPRYAADFVRIFRCTLETGERYYAAERAVKRVDRDVTEYYEWQTSRIRLPDGRFGVVCYFRDISAQVAARARVVASEECARRALEEAEAANRAKDDFLATVSHELRAPLQGILGWLALLKNGQLDAMQTMHALESVERSVRLQAQLVRDITDLSRATLGTVILERAPVDVATLLASTAEEFTPGAVAKSIKLVVHTPRSGLVLGDPERLHQVIANLVGNAIKFTPAGGCITLSCRDEAHEVVIEVADTGEGIDAGFLPRLFQRFTQQDPSTTRRHGGLGLGLAIVRQLVELHGGTITAESPGPGRGSTFCVRLPTALPAMPASLAPHAATPGPLPRLDGVEILLVEDDRDTLDAMTMALEAMGARVSAAGSAGEAFSAFTEHPPDLLVSDLGMPHEDGYALLRRIRGIRPPHGVPAIALTGYARPEDRERALSEGFAAHVPKPVDPDRFVRLLADIVREHRIATA